MVSSEIVVTRLNASFEMRFRFIGGLTVGFAASEDRSHQALLLSPWPESLLAFEPVWWRLAKHAHLVAGDLPGFGRSQRSDSLLSRGRWQVHHCRVATCVTLPGGAFGTGRPAVTDRHPGADHRRRWRYGSAAGSTPGCLYERLPHSTLDVIDAGHFTWEDTATEYAALVTGWWRGAASGAKEMSTMPGPDHGAAMYMAAAASAADAVGHRRRP